MHVTPVFTLQSLFIFLVSNFKRRKYFPFVFSSSITSFLTQRLARNDPSPFSLAFLLFLFLPLDHRHFYAIKQIPETLFHYYFCQMVAGFTPALTQSASYALIALRLLCSHHYMVSSPCFFSYVRLEIFALPTQAATSLPSIGLVQTHHKKFQIFKSSETFWNAQIVHFIIWF